MRTVKAKKIKDYFSSDSPLRSDDFENSQVTNYYTRRRFFSKFTFFVFLAFCSLMSGFYFRAGWVVGITIVLYLNYLYFLGKSVASSLSVKRTAPPQAIAGQKIRIEFKIENSSSFKAKNFLIVDSFFGCLKPEIAIWVERALSSGEIRTETCEKVCDGGMGIQEFGLLAIKTSDPLGVFDFYILEDGKQSVEVYPQLQTLPDLKIPGSNQSFVFGLYDVQTKGGSLNFAGIRDYVRGDSLRHIAWKPSAKNSRLMVKEFEKVVDSTVTIVLEMNGRYHLGSQSKSTWEYAKQVALGVVAQEIAHGNSVQLISNEKCIPLGRGDTHAQWITAEVFKLFPYATSSNIDKNPDEDLSEDAPEGGFKPLDLCVPLTQSHRHLIPPGSTVVYVGPTTGDSLKRTLDDLIHLKEDRVNAMCLLLDSSSFLPSNLGSDHVLAISVQLEATKQLIKSYAKKLFEYDIPISIVKYKKTATESLIKTVAQL